MDKRSRTVRATGAALAATTAFGFFAPAANAVPENTVPLSADRAARHLNVVATHTAKPASAPTAKKATTYTVKSGDTLWGIAKKHSSSVSAIAKANGIKNTSYIRIGQKLTIPGSSSSAKATSSSSKASSTPAKTTSTGSRHVVRSGETLSSIAKKYNTSTSAIQKSNSLSNPNLIYVGQVLTIGGSGSKATSSSSKASSTPAKTTSTGSRHVVRSGETLSSIAKKYNTSTSAIQKSNSLSNPNLIYVGQVLTIGGSTSASTSSSKNSVGNTFLGYTYPESTTNAANANKDQLKSGSVPSRAQMQQIIRQTAVNMGVDPSLALAHAQVESGFDQSAVSPANAIGAMQVIPSSGDWASQLVGRKLNLLDPYDNATAGVAIIRYLQTNASSKDQGIAGYYQGLGGVRKYGMYPDTKNYVAKVKAAQANY
ncbi:lytic transglycosylase domain-containing protein [Ancrocorticia populi]|uniref:lytic transglycosylase domain-containing protein n=1 Tax=Ancrocorticia populi TaxID=2175228 RepID=UPI002352F151|nr:lytic transglycosylase domain-containing protein [Ancrocorticia populi]